MQSGSGILIDFVKYEFLKMALAEDSDLVGCDAVLLVE